MVLREGRASDASVLTARVGRAPSGSIPGRWLPRLRYVLVAGRLAETT
jgi:hypothetical protein